MHKFTLELTQEQIGLIDKALGTMSFREVHELYAELQRQIVKQQQEAAVMAPAANGHDTVEQPQ